MKANQHKVAIVTGASQGIGYAIAKYLIKEGYQLLLVSRNEEKLKIIVDEFTKLNPRVKSSSIAALDVSDYAKVKECVGKFIANVGHVDLLCTSAGYAKRGTTDLHPDEFLKMIHTNLIGVFNFIHVIAPFMKENKSGRIINIASRSGKVARKQTGGYAASKFGVMGLNESLHKELAAYGIYVTAICPNWVATDMTSDIDVNKDEMIQTDDIVKTVDYLLKISPAVYIREIVMQCRLTLISE